MKTIRIVTLVVLATGITLNPIMAINVMSLEDAAKKGLIKLFIKSKGGYSGEVIEMKIKNSSNKNLDFKLETGRKLDSKNNAEQDILVTKPQEFNVCGGQTRTINVFGMCCQAHNMCPRENSEYSIGTMADSTLIKLAMFIDKNKYYTNSSAQQAVWTVSDNNSLGSITDGNKVDVNNLRNFVSKITGKTIPPYEVTYSRENDRDLLGRVKTIEGTFDYALPDNTRKQEKPDLPFLDGWNKLQDIGIDFHKIIKKTPGYLLDFKEDSSAYFALVYLDRIDIEDKRKKRKIKENVISKLKETINKNENLKESSKITTSRQNQSQKLKVNKINLN